MSNRVARLRWLALLIVGCGGSDAPPADQFIEQPGVSVRPEILNNYVGTYRLPSGALLHVTCEGDTLLAGVPPFELVPRSTREFASNRSPADLIFERDESGNVSRLNFRMARRDLWIERVDESDAVDPTIMVDAGGHRLRMLVTGTGGPAVVIEDGFGSCIETRSELQARLTQFTTVVTYDHAGSGGSEEGSQPRDARTIARELHTALLNASVDAPWILVGGSIGVDYMLVFADEFPDETAGLVLLDPTPDFELIQAWLQEQSPTEAAAFSEMMERGDAVVREMLSYQEQGRRQEWAAMDEIRNQAKAVLPLTGIPVTQITGAAQRRTVTMARNKVRFFEDWLDRNLPEARHVLAENSGHAVFCAEPDLVVSEVQTMVEQAREQ